MKTKATIALLALAVISVPLYAQTSQGTYTCRALTEISEVAVSTMDVRELNNRMQSLMACADSDSEWKEIYVKHQAIALIELESRLFNFVMRHDLFGKFKDEDAQGMR